MTDKKIAEFEEFLIQMGQQQKQFQDLMSEFMGTSEDDQSKVKIWDEAVVPAQDKLQ